ncbi:MAG: hypothetical protein JW947_11050, partial [Sedimentisphaerales bacterium]|nr:hypothetical protein [Sedimentisphaerales bacterium]
KFNGSKYLLNRSKRWLFYHEFTEDILQFRRHSPFPLPGSRLGSELLHYSEVARAAMFPLSSFRLIRKSGIPHTHSTFRSILARFYCGYIPAFLVLI